MNINRLETPPQSTVDILRQKIEVLRREITENTLFPMLEFKVLGKVVNNRARLVVNQHRAQLSFRITSEDSEKLIATIKRTSNCEVKGLHYLGHSQQFGDHLPAGVGIKISDALVISQGNVELFVSLGTSGNQHNIVAEGLIAIDILSGADLKNVEVFLQLLSTILASPLDIDWKDIHQDNRWEPPKENNICHKLEELYGKIMVYHRLPWDKEKVVSITKNGLLSVDELICRGAPYSPGFNALNILENRDNFDQYFDFYTGSALYVHTRAILCDHESDEFKGFQDGQGPIIVFKARLLDRLDGRGSLRERYTQQSRSLSLTDFFASLNQNPSKSNELLFPIRITNRDIAAIVVQSEKRKDELMSYLTADVIEEIAVIVAQNPEQVSQFLTIR